ncbi:DUF3240 family protein [Neptunicella marina]|uniref:DUF3240 family protein n=1 Tax=Neptunicella marina TaxID=2125989 RepID=A0A8J6LZW3_9ALTE|nr:DUF3240 family protein [Neptunicella marina]MBC3766505.1 DUF3240 family protein [Neptunicella marina]
MQTDDQILNIMVPESIKDDVVDLLIALEVLSGFNLYRVDGFSREHSKYDLNEQVEGYRNLYRFEVIHNTQDFGQILDTLKPLSHATSLRYWITPILSGGHIETD